MVRYCKAYTHRDIRHFYTMHALPVPEVLACEAVSFLWDDLCVRKSPVRQEEILLEVTLPAWRDFCATQLAFTVPAQTDEREAPGKGSAAPVDGCAFVPFSSGQRWLLSEMACTGEFFLNALILQLSLHPFHIQDIERILRYLWHYHDALRLKLTNQEQRWQQYLVDPDEALPATWICLTRLAAPEQMSVLEHISHEMQRKINTLQDVLWHFSFCEIDEATGYLVWVINHFITDATSNQLLLQDFHVLHNQLQQKKPLKLPEQKTTFRAWTEYMSAYLASSVVQQEVQEYWLALPWEHVKPIPLDFPAGMTLDPYTFRSSYGSFASIRHHHFALSPAQTQQLLSTAASLHLQLFDMLLAAMALTIAAWSGSTVAHIFVQDNARLTTFKDISLIHTVGYIAHVRRLLFTINDAHAPQEVLLAIKDQLEQAPNRGRTIDWLLHQEQVPEALQHIPWSDVYFNFSGKSATSLQQSPLAPFQLSYPQHYRNHLLASELSLYKGSLEARWEYSTEIHRASTIETWAAYFTEKLCSFNSYPASQRLLIS